jgi:hypothetical protein
MKPWVPTKEECLALEEAIKAARRVQTFLWGEANGSWGLEEWLRMFRKRVAKLEEVKRDNPHAAIELKKRLLQTAALSVALCGIIDKEGVPWDAAPEAPPSNLPQFAATVADPTEPGAKVSTPALDALLADSNAWRGNMAVRKAFGEDTQALQLELAKVMKIAENRLDFIELVCKSLGVSFGQNMFEKALSRLANISANENWMVAYDKVCRERDELLKSLGRIADAAHAGQSNLSREESIAKIVGILDAVMLAAAGLDEWIRDNSTGKELAPGHTEVRGSALILRASVARDATPGLSQKGQSPEEDTLSPPPQSIECDCWEGCNDREGRNPCPHERLPEGGHPFENTSSPGKCRCGAEGPPWKHLETCQYD